MKALSLVVVAIAVAACSFSPAAPQKSNSAQLSAPVSPKCKTHEGHHAALKAAAITTLKREFERFDMFYTGYHDNIRSNGRTPAIAGTRYRRGSAVTYFNGRSPTSDGNQLQRIIIHMYNADDEGFDNAIDAREILGEDWKEIVKQDVDTC